MSKAKIKPASPIDTGPRFLSDAEMGVWPIEAENVFACRLGAHYRAQARAGDVNAAKALARISPQDVPPAERKRHRDAVLRAIAARLRADHGALSTGQAIAKLLAEAGEWCCYDPEAPLPDWGPYRHLLADERVWLRQQIVDLIHLLELDRWPSASTMRRVLA
jgi:hypothetical protein